jgi:mannose-6-phosphate isomerase-like protein (cupin superfamily)
MAQSDRQPAKVIGADAILRDRPGLAVEFLSRNSIPDAPYAPDRHEVLLPMRGYWRPTRGGGATVLNPGDTAAIPAGMEHSLTPAVTGEAHVYRMRNTDDQAGITRRLS